MIVFRLIGLLFDLILLPIRALRRASFVREGTWLSVTVDGPVVDVVPRPRFWQVRAQRAVSLHWLDEVITTMISDRRIKGILVTLRSMRGGMAAATSLRSMLARARAAGKEVAVHLPMGGDTKEVYVATAASKIFLGPATQLAPLGFRTSARYVKQALDRAGLEPQVFACGEFKSAGETLVRESMSSEQRAQLERVLDSFHGALVDAIASGRGVSHARAAEIVDQAPYFGRAAIDAGLADDLAYEDEVLAKLEGDGAGERAGPPRPSHPSRPSRSRRKRAVLDAATYLACKRPLVRRLLRRPVVLVVPVHGAITHAGGVLGELSTDERVGRMLRVARLDRRVAGVILHVDSPGGSALASDLVHHEIVQLARDKPVVACMANVAASGGYYVAAPAACIVAQPTTITGSIGVVAARLSVEPLLSRLGVRTEVIERGARASLLSPVGEIDDGDREALLRQLTATYRAFVGVVAAGRKMSEDDVERLARGRVYTGEDARAAGLVDALGGFDVALEQLKRLLPSRQSERVEILVARPPRSPVRAPHPSAPRKDEDGRRALLLLLATLLPPRERMLLELGASGERVLAVGPIVET